MLSWKILFILVVLKVIVVFTISVIFAVSAGFYNFPLLKPSPQL